MCVWMCARECVRMNVCERACEYVRMDIIEEVVERSACACVRVDECLIVNACV